MKKMTVTVVVSFLLIFTVGIIGVHAEEPVTRLYKSVNLLEDVEAEFVRLGAFSAMGTADFLSRKERISAGSSKKMMEKILLSMDQKLDETTIDGWKLVNIVIIAKRPVGVFVKEIPTDN